MALRLPDSKGLIHIMSRVEEPEMEMKEVLLSRDVWSPALGALIGFGINRIAANFGST